MGVVTAVDATIIDRPDAWDAVVGQDHAVAQLKAAAAHPVHAYLLVGPAGSGKRAAAAAFAGVLLACDAASGGRDPDRALALALAETHPDLHVFEPEGASLRVSDAEEITRAAHRSPVEGDRKVLVLTEFEKVAQAGPALLKTIEEPPASTVFVVLAEEVPPELVPIASRAARIELGSVPEEAVVERLVAEGTAEELARSVAAAAGGDLRRARLLVGDRSLGVRRDAWATIPLRVDGTGHIATQLVDEVLAHIDAAQEPLTDRHALERAELTTQIEAYGQPRTLLKELEVRQKREVRRHRTGELRFGLATMAATYRDRLADAPDPRPHLAALDAIQGAADAWVRNPNEVLLLQALVAGLDPI
jgi:DNA polymerase-3 subunit delta'